MKTSNTQRTIDAYNKNAVKYASKFDNYEIYKKKISEFQKKYIARGTHILDLGCGPGNNIKTILQLDNTCSFTGIDLSKEFINIARLRFPQFNFLQQNICNLEIKTKYEVVIASFCIVHLTDDETDNFFASLSDVIANNGYLYLSYMNGEKSGFESTSFSEEKIFFNYYQDQFVINLMSESGISVLEIGKEEYMEPDGSKTIDTFIYAKKKK